jgi:hypothetical protein
MVEAESGDTLVVATEETFSAVLSHEHSLSPELAGSLFLDPSFAILRVVGAVILRTRGHLSDMLPCGLFDVLEEA